MSQITKIILISIILHISTVSSTVSMADFNEFHYDRICSSNKYDLKSICIAIATLPEERGAYPRIEDVSGSCLTLYVQVAHPESRSRVVDIKAEILLCNIGPNYKICASASTNNGIIEYYHYNLQGHAQHCVHAGSINNPSPSGSGNTKEQGEDKSKDEDKDES